MRPPRILVLLTVASLLAPPRAWAAPESDAKALAAFEAGFTAGQGEFDRGEFLAAARTWVEAAGKLKETMTNRDNRAAVYEYVVDAYTRGLAGETKVEPLREAAQALDGYCDGFTRAYGTETPLSPKIVAARDDFKARLAEAEARAPKATPDPVEPAGPDEPPKDEPKPGGKPWKGLAIGGGVALGLGVVGVALGAVGGVKSKSFNDEFEAMSCSLDMPNQGCKDLLSSGKSANTQAYVGAIAGGVLVGVGVALLAVGLTRKKAARQAWSPALGPGFVGLSLRGSF